jgi:sodium/hydrogen antiporter
LSFLRGGRKPGTARYAGIVFGTAGGVARDGAQPLPAQDLGALLNALTFVFFGATFMKPLVEWATWQVPLYALLSLTFVRVVPAAVATLGTR